MGDAKLAVVPGADEDSSADAGAHADAAAPKGTTITLEEAPHPSGGLALWVRTSASEERSELFRLAPRHHCALSKAGHTRSSVGIDCALGTQQGRAWVSGDRLHVMIGERTLEIPAPEPASFIGVVEGPPRPACPEGAEKQDVQIVFLKVKDEVVVRIPSLAVESEGWGGENTLCSTGVIADRRIDFGCGSGISGERTSFVVEGDRLRAMSSWHDTDGQGSRVSGAVDLPCGARLTAKPVNVRGAKFGYPGGACRASCREAVDRCGNPCLLQHTDDGELTEQGEACMSKCSAKYQACELRCSTRGK